MTEKQYNRKKMSAICSLQSYKVLEQWIKDRYPQNPYPTPPEKYFYSNTTHREYLSKLLEDIIVKMLRAKGTDPIKANDKGKYIGKKYVTDVLGHKKETGQIWARSKKTRPGRADIVVFYKGKLFNFEVKIGKDRQSEEQKQEQKRAESNGEVYIIIKTVDEFLKLL